jgi:hypothetical protein
MAKKSDAHEQFLADLIAAVPEIQRPYVEEALKADTVSRLLRDSVLNRSDYSRQSDSLAEERRAFEAEVAEARRRVAGWEEWYATSTQELANAQARIAELETSSPTTPDPLTADFVSRDEITKQLQERDRYAIAFADLLTDLKIEHRDRFKEKLDTTALTQFAQRRGIPLDAAYPLFVADRVEVQRTKDLEERVKREREDAVKEYASAHRLPVSPGPSEPHVLDTRENVSGDSRDRVRAAVAAWNNSAHAST